MFEGSTTAEFVLPDHFAAPPIPGGLVKEAALAVVLRLLHGGGPITDAMVAQAAYRCDARRAKVGEHLKRHRNVAKAFAKAFACATADERDAFIQSIGCAKIWNALTQ
jgi:hypothetical protein